jgi:hypothetical protein
MYEGEARTFPHTWTEKETGNPIDLTGSSIEFDCKEHEFSRSAVITDAANGKYELQITEADTLGKVSKGGRITIRYLVKHVGSGGDVRYIYRLNIVVVGVHDD